MGCKTILNYLSSERIFKRLDDLRKKRGMSFFDLAKKANVSSSAIYKWRDRRSSPSLYLLESLCEVLDIRLLNLFADDSDLVYLTEEEKVFFNHWNALKKEQKAYVSALMEAMQKENE